MTTLKKAKVVPKKPVQRSFKNRSISIRSRHPSIDPLRGNVFFAKKAVYRHGSVSEHPSTYEINTTQCVKNSSSKLLMKQCFDTGGVKHLPWILLSKAKIQDGGLTDGTTTLKFPIVVKNFYGSRGTGNFKINNVEEFQVWHKGHGSANYLAEPFYTGQVEFRIHITNYGPIYCLRKLLKKEVEKDKRWVRNDSTCVWITEFTQNKTPGGEFLNFTTQSNPQFDKPKNWNEILEECTKALKSVGGDVLAVDVKAQSNKTTKGNSKDKVDFYILEVNSAPSMGNITLEIYKTELPKILKFKYGNS